MRRQFTEKIGGTLFLDFGQVSLHSFDVPIDNLIASQTGLGVLLYHASGTSALGVGLSVRSAAQRDQAWQVHFSIGQSFSNKERNNAAELLSGILSTTAAILPLGSEMGIVSWLPLLLAVGIQAAARAPPIFNNCFHDAELLTVHARRLDARRDGRTIEDVSGSSGWGWTFISTCSLRKDGMGCVLSCDPGR